MLRIDRGVQSTLVWLEVRLHVIAQNFSISPHLIPVVDKGIEVLIAIAIFDSDAPDLKF